MKEEDKKPGFFRAETSGNAPPEIQNDPMMVEINSLLQEGFKHFEQAINLFAMVLIGNSASIITLANGIERFAEQLNLVSEGNEYEKRKH